MIAAFVVGLVATITNPELPRAEMSKALASFERLAALSADKPGATIEEKATRQPQKAELDALLTYLVKVDEVITIGNFEGAYLQSYMTVVMQTVAAGKQLAVTPEEALCWDRAALDYATAIRRYSLLQVQVGRFPPQALHQVSAMNHQLQRDYRKTIAGLVENLR